MSDLLLRARTSKNLVICVIFIAMMLDLIVMTTLEPILPDILYRIDDRVDADDSKTVHYTSTSHRIGILLALKPGVEITANLFVGVIVHRFGHKYPMALGCFGNFIATLGFAFARSFQMLMISRVIQAIGSSLSVVSGLALLASVFKNEDERARATGIAFGGLSFGIIIGFPFGSTTYQFFGRPTTFLILSFLTIVDGALRLFLLVPEQIQNEKNERSNLAHIIVDPYVILVLVCNTLIHIALGAVVTTEAAWMMEYLGAEQWNIGLVLFGAALVQLAAQYFTGLFSTYLGRWLVCFIGVQLTVLGLVNYPFCTVVWYVLVPETLFRAGLGIVLTTLSPLLAHIIDVRHGSKYGAVYGLYAASYNLGLVIGPLAGGALLHMIGFDRLYQGMGAVLFFSSFICTAFKHIQSKHERLIDPEKSQSNYSTISSQEKADMFNNIIDRPSSNIDIKFCNNKLNKEHSSFN